MRLPLLVNGTPKELASSPIVLIPAGKWKITTENLIDSVLLPCQLDLQIPTPLMIDFAHKGTETNLNIYAELLE